MKLQYSVYITLPKLQLQQYLLLAGEGRHERPLHADGAAQLPHAAHHLAHVVLVRQRAAAAPRPGRGHVPGLGVPHHVQRVGDLRHAVEVEAARVARHAARALAQQRLGSLVVREKQSAQLIGSDQKVLCLIVKLGNEQFMLEGTVKRARKEQMVFVGCTWAWRARV